MRKATDSLQVTSVLQQWNPNSAAAMASSFVDPEEGKLMKVI